MFWLQFYDWFLISFGAPINYGCGNDETLYLLDQIVEVLEEFVPVYMRYAGVI